MYEHQGGKREWDGLGDGDWRMGIYTTVYKIGNYWEPTVEPRKLYLVFRGDLNGNFKKKGYICTYIWLIHFAAQQKLLITQCCKATILQLKKQQHGVLGSLKQFSSENRSPHAASQVVVRLHCAQGPPPAQGQQEVCCGPSTVWLLTPPSVNHVSEWAKGRFSHFHNLASQL